MTLAEKQTHRQMEQNLEPRNKITCMQASNFSQEEGKTQEQKNKTKTQDKRKPLQ